jgi:hypothetical protein
MKLHPQEIDDYTFVTINNEVTHWQPLLVHIN